MFSTDSLMDLFEFGNDLKLEKRRSEIEISSDVSVAFSDNESVEPIKAKAFLLIDPWSTGNLVWEMMEKSGYKVVVVWENKFVRSEKESSEVLLHEDLEETLFTVKEVMCDKYEFYGVVAGSETAVPLAEELAHLLNLPTNLPNKAKARRNKYLMGETLRQSGVRAVKQIITKDLEEASKFVTENLCSGSTFEVIVKPNMGAGSDDVFLCKTFEDFKNKFNIVNGKINSLGLLNDGVLVQEFLTGTEYVVDSVSKNGNHEICAIWKYDKREANGRFNVYHGTFPLANNSEISKSLVSYIYFVLNALDFKNGPSHAEIKMTETGPCLVEIGARCHGGGGSWFDLANICFGMNQVENVINSFDKSKKLEKFPTNLKHFGAVVDMVYYESGTLESISNIEQINQLESVKEVKFYNKVGDNIIATVDCNTQPGHIVLMHSSEQQVLDDYNKIHKLFKQKNIFTIR